MKQAEKKLLLTIAAVIAAVGYFVFGAILWLNNPAQAKTDSAAAGEIIQLTNTYRHGLGLSELTINPRLTQAAIDRAKDILAKQYFNHTTPDGRRFSDFVKEVNYKYFYVGENLAIDFSNSQDIFDAWLKSDSHRQNLERKEYQEIGVASLQGEFENRDTNIVVQLFGSRVLGANELSLATAYGVDNYFSSGGLSSDRTLRAISFCRVWLNWLLVIILLLLGLVFLQQTTPPVQPSVQQNKKSPTGNSRSRTSKTVKKPKAKQQSTQPKSRDTKRKR